MNPTQTSAGVFEPLRTIEDPRLDRQKLHELFDILVIALIATICGVDSFMQMEDFGISKESWFRQFLSLKNGIPSHDTFNRVFALLDPEALDSCLSSIVQTLLKRGPKSKTIALDGKTLRGSFDEAKGQSALHLVSAFATETHLLLGQVKTQEKSNEITAMPELLALLDLSGTIVTIDAMGCQTDIAKQIKDQGGDYILSLKGNQGTLHEDTKTLFRYEKQRKHKQARVHTEIDKGHGRIETRTCEVLLCPKEFVHREHWEGIQSLIRIQSHRDLGDKVTSETRYYISSLLPDPKQMLQAIRSHWAVENNLHWSLDVSFREDLSRVRKDQAPENLATLRRISWTLLKQETSCKLGIASKRTKAAYDPAYLLKVLQL